MATVEPDDRDSVGDIGVDARPPRCARGRGDSTKIEAGSIELIVAKTGFVTLALPAGFVLPAGLAQFDAVKAHVAVGTDGKLTLLSIRSDDDNNRDDDQVGRRRRGRDRGDRHDHRALRHVHHRLAPLVLAGDVCAEQAVDRL